VDLSRQSHGSVKFDHGLPVCCTSLKAIESAARISSFNPAQFDSVKQAAAQIAAFRSPLEQLKNMSSIASAMA